MTYHDNEVIVNGTNGLKVEINSFTVTDFRVTEGQDPDHSIGSNPHPKKVTSGKITFRVGRKKTKPVADWFNGQFSQYNDASVNGDRTTFDHNAGALNFAFMGDLVITVSGGDLSVASKVTFKNVCFAQGSTGVNNNWWFAQRIGQHTKNSGNCLLAIGSTSNNRTVYASFRRGGKGNKVNEVTLQSIHIVSDMPREYNHKVSNMPNVFSKFPESPAKGTPFSLLYMPTLLGGHVKGYTALPDNDCVVLSHSSEKGSYARIVAGFKHGFKNSFKSYKKRWRQPGGIHAIGDYVLVPTEMDKADKSGNKGYITMYDTRSLHVNELRRVEAFNGGEGHLGLKHKACSLGVTDYTDDKGNTYYLLIVCNGSNEYFIYRAEATKNLEKVKFTSISSFYLPKNFGGFGLLTGTDNSVYVLGLYSEFTGSYRDEMYLYELIIYCEKSDDGCWKTIQTDNVKHVVSSGGGATGVHFRFGAGAFASSNGKVMALATEGVMAARSLYTTLRTDQWVSP